MACANLTDEIDELVRRNGAHNAQLERRSFKLHIVLGETLHRLGILKNLGKVRMDHAAQLSQMRIAAFSMEKQTAEFLLEANDGTRQSGLRHVAFVGGLGEIQFLRHGKEVSDLEHFHGANSVNANNPHLVSLVGFLSVYEGHLPSFQLSPPVMRRAPR
jgi:hypothetical protein